MKNTERIKRLQDAHAQVKAVQDSLDISQSKCEHCDSSRYGNWDEKQSHDTLGGVLNKIERVKRILNGEVNRK